MPWLFAVIRSRDKLKVRILSLDSRRYTSRFACSINTEWQRPALRVITLFPFSPLRARPTAKAGDLSRCLHLLEQAAQVVAADTGTKTLQLRDREFAGDVFQRLPQQLGLRPARRFDVSSALLELGARWPGNDSAKAASHACLRASAANFAIAHGSNPLSPLRRAAPG